MHYLFLFTVMEHGNPPKKQLVAEVEFLIMAARKFHMKKSRTTDSQILSILKQAKAGTPVPALCREHGMSSATFTKWRSRYGGRNEVVPY